MLTDLECLNELKNALVEIYPTEREQDLLEFYNDKETDYSYEWRFRVPFRDEENKLTVNKQTGEVIYTNGHGVELPLS